VVGDGCSTGVGSDRAVVGGDRASTGVGGDRASAGVGYDRAVVSRDRAVVSRNRVVVSRNRAATSVGCDLAVVGGDHAIVGGHRAVVGDDRACITGKRSKDCHNQRGTGAIGIAEAALDNRMLRGGGHCVPLDGACDFFIPVAAIVPIGVLRLMEIERGRRIAPTARAGADDIWEWAAAKHELPVVKINVSTLQRHRFPVSINPLPSGMSDSGDGASIVPR